jgi:hypothetical protein
LPPQWADRSIAVHAQGKISAVFFYGNFSATPHHLMFRKRSAADVPDAISRHDCAAGETSSCRKKNPATRVAFSLPQDSSAQLMFETCVNGGSELSAFRGVGFDVGRGAAGPARRLRMRHKRLNRRPNFLGCTGDRSRCAV